MKKQEFTWDNRLTEMLNELKKSEKGTEDQSVKFVTSSHISTSVIRRSRVANIKSITKQLEDLTDVIKSKKNFRVMPFPLITACILTVLKSLELITLSWWIIGLIAVFPLALVVSVLIVLGTLAGIGILGVLAYDFFKGRF
ncbi:hypothetical protein [Stenotrophomonas phage IME-SM1]|uniref:Uncharacterized protein n=1 Tax=Stenotrophomonas phage IME-SM1 TaxID=1654717 RepID=A0A0H4J2F9_9CAUD|nr:hypothetical protein KMC40_gp190 [Stenotrophomonas phage IME-SM1]AKO61568.1 hypothetical protein [Stenotrophomonas phage IME-SM1]